MPNKSFFNSQKGQSLIEVIIALTVGVFVVTALTFSVIFALRNANFAKTSAQATKLAQEGIERVRTGRGRNQCINDLDQDVDSWNGDSGNIACPGAGTIWYYPITGSYSNCENTTVPGSKCYFNVDQSGSLTNIGYASVSFPSSAETINSANQTFQRVVVLSDESSNYNSQKKVTVIVRWSDFSGPHDSVLTTILRKI